MTTMTEDDDSVTIVDGENAQDVECFVKVAPLLKDMMVEEGEFISMSDSGRKKILRRNKVKGKTKTSSLKKKSESRPRLEMPTIRYQCMQLSLDSKHPHATIENTDAAVRTIAQKLKAGPLASDT